jgi:hypothetical protein
VRVVEIKHVERGTERRRDNPDKKGTDAMRRLMMLLVVLGLAQLGCRHVGGGCDCEHNAPASHGGGVITAVPAGAATVAPPMIGGGAAPMPK